VGVYKWTHGDSLDDLDDPLTVDDIVRIRNDAQDVELGALTTERKSPKTDEKATTTGKPSQSQEPYHEKHKCNPLFYYLPYGQCISDEWDCIQEFLNPQASLMTPIPAAKLICILNFHTFYVCPDCAGSYEDICQTSCTNCQYIGQSGKIGCLLPKETKAIGTSNNSNNKE
jgi:hypothetical protein